MFLEVEIRESPKRDPLTRQGFSKQRHLVLGRHQTDDVLTLNTANLQLSITVVLDAAR